MYPIDDPYIHMAMARHFAESGVFGVSLAGFSATSSSPLWTLLLGTTFKVFGNHETIPLLLNVIFGLALAVYFTRLLADRLQSVWAASLGGTALLFVLPLPTLVALGMEHTLHILLALALVERASRILFGEDTQTATGSILLLAFLATLTRFETMFLVFPLAAFCWIAREKKAAAALAAGCALPILALGFININNGWFFFPTSIMLKSALSMDGWERIQTMAERLFGQLFGSPHIVVPFVFAIAALFSTLRDERLTTKNFLWIGVFIAATVFHCSQASIGWFYRYEGYLLAIGAVALAPFARETGAALRDAIPRCQRLSERWLIGGGVAAILALTPFPFYKQCSSLEMLVPSARNIYSQQYQMGLFLKKYYKGEAILANDIGAINYLADMYCLDVMGLGSVEPIRAKMQETWSPRFLHSWCAQHRVAVAVVYESWLRKLIPPGWIKAGEWTVNEKISVADSTVSFFALIPQEAERLRANLQSFESQLPNGVKLKLQNL